MWHVRGDSTEDSTALPVNDCPNGGGGSSRARIRCCRRWASRRHVHHRRQFIPPHTECIQSGIPQGLALNLCSAIPVFLRCLRVRHAGSAHWRSNSPSLQYYFTILSTSALHLNASIEAFTFCLVASLHKRRGPR